MKRDIVHNYTCQIDKNPVVFTCVHCPVTIQKEIRIATWTNQIHLMDVGKLETVVNPFQRRDRPQWIEKIKRMVLSVTLFPIRLVCIGGIIITQNIYARICLIGHDPKLPLPPWRMFLLEPLRYLTRLMLFVAGFVYISVKGTPSTKKECPIILGNHVSAWEPFYISCVHMSMAVVRGESQNDPIFGPVMKAASSIFVDRDDPDSRRKVANEIVRRTNDPDYPPLLIFPEGTCTNGEALITFKNGAFNPGLPVQPFLVRYPNQHLNLSWSGDLSMLGLLFQTMCQFVNYMEIEYLDVYYPSEEEKHDPSLYARNVRNLMSEKLNVPCTQHSHDDVKLYLEALKSRSDFKLNFTLDELRRNFKLEAKEGDLHRILTVFQSWDKNGDSLIDEAEFEEALVQLSNNSVSLSARLKQKKYARKLFRLFDLDENGFIDFREFVIGMNLANRAHVGDPNGHLDLAFEVYNESGNGKITKSELGKIIKVVNPVVSTHDLAEKVDSLYAKCEKCVNGEIDLNNFKKMCEMDHDLVKMASSVLQHVAYSQTTQNK
jgi:lysophosphatidylcholine acyltransferase/lyso-PAF acetyltransferase